MNSSAVIDAPVSDHTHSPEVERAVLAVLLDGRHATAFDSILATISTPLAFYHRDHRIIVMAAHDVAAAGERVSAQTVIEALSHMRFGDVIGTLAVLAGEKPPRPRDDETVSYDDSALAAVGGVNAVTDMAAMSSPAVSLERNCRIIADHYRQRQTIVALSTALDQLRAPSGVKHVSEIVDRALTAAMAQTASGGTKSLGDGLAAALELHDKRQAGHAVRCAVAGLPGLDAAAWMQPGELWFLAAPPGCGKTSLELHYLTATAKAYGPGSVALVSREMGARELGAVMAARRLRCPRQLVDHGKLKAGQREIAQEERHAVDKMGIAVRDTIGSCTVDDIAAWATGRQRLTGTLAFLAIDYLQIISPTKPQQKDYEKITEATMKLKQLARTLDIPILVLSQLSREGRKQERGRGGMLQAQPEPQLSDLKGSGSIEQDADGVLFLWRPDERSPLVHAKVAKNRAGPRRSIDLLFFATEGQRFVDTSTGVETEGHGNTAMFTKPSADPNDEIIWERKQP